MKKNNPIGIFDSGVGGTSIWKEVHALLPFENIIYLADSKNAPYGYKTEEEIVSLSIKNTELLTQMGCKLIIVACNTATTNAISILRSKYNIPIIGIEPAIKPAALKTISKSIGILATKGTLSSALFHKASEALTNDISVIEVIGEGLVSLIEKGETDTPKMFTLLQKYMKPMLEANVDYIVLGCSHYPYIIPQLKKIVPNHVTVIDSGEAVAKQTQHILQENLLLRKEKTTPLLQFYTNAVPNALQQLLSSYSNKISVERKDF